MSFFAVTTRLAGRHWVAMHVLFPTGLSRQMVTRQDAISQRIRITKIFMTTRWLFMSRLPTTWERVEIPTDWTHLGTVFNFSFERDSAGFSSLKQQDSVVVGTVSKSFRNALYRVSRVTRVSPSLDSDFTLIFWTVENKAASKFELLAELEIFPEYFFRQVLLRFLVYPM